MDSLSQFVLGAAVGGAVVGRRAGIKSLAWGGLIATLPDLDVLVPLADPVSRFTYHRSASHSLLVLTLLAPLLAWLVTRFHASENGRYRPWLVAVWLILVTHVVLDALTNYGTQLFWPISSMPVGWGSIFIIDPLYTVPLTLGVIVAAVVGRNKAKLHRWAVGALVVSTSYLALGVGIKLHVDHRIRSELAERGIEYESFATSPTALNIVLWRGVVLSGPHYYEIFYSLLDRNTVSLQQFPTSAELLHDISDSWAVRRLQWFTDGYYRVRSEGDAIVMTDLRMGQEPWYAFSFVVGEHDAEGRIIPVPNRRAESAPMSAEMLSAVLCKLGSGVKADC